MFIEPQELPVKEPREGWRGRFFHSDNMTFSCYEVVAGSWVHEHQHENEEVWNIIEGRFEVTVDGETREVGAGAAAIVSPNVRHAVKALTDGRAIVVDHPRRHVVGGVDLD